MKQNSITEILRHTIEHHDLFKPGATVVVGFSGGADSTALLHLLHSLSGYDLTLVAVHLNHSLRGNESDQDEEFCRRTAQKLGIACESRRIDVAEIAARQRLNLEEAGRNCRISFLDEVAVHYGATAIALGHHADDQTETVLMRFLRGSGMTGLSGIAYRNRKGYVRPLLDIPGKTLRDWLQEQNIPWREDTSNNNSTFLRNRIRHQLLPLLETYNPAIRQTINATAEIIATDNSLLQRQAFELFQQLCTTSEASVQVDGKQLLRLDPALQRRIVRLMYRQVSGSLHRFGKEHCRQCIELCQETPAHSAISLPNGIAAYNSYDTLILSPAQQTGSKPAGITITGAGSYYLWDGSIVSVTEHKRSAESVRNDNRRITLDTDTVPFPWLVRTFEPGDRFQPCGMAGHKKIKNLFIDLKIPPDERKNIPLFIAYETTFWVGGIRASGATTLTDNSTRTFTITLHKAHHSQGDRIHATQRDQN